MMFSFGKPAADPTSDLIQVRRAMAHHDFCVAALFPVGLYYVPAPLSIAIAYASTIVLSLVSLLHVR